MAEIDLQIRKKTISGGFDTYFPFTKAENVSTSDGRSVQQRLDAMASGVTEFNDLLGPKATITKTIPLGVLPKHGVAIIGGTRGVFVFFGTDPLQTKVLGSTHSGYNEFQIWTRRKSGYITDTGVRYDETTGDGYGHWALPDTVDMLDMYISGSNIIVKFENKGDTTARNIGAHIDWEVW